MWDQTGKTLTTGANVLEDVGHAASCVHGEGAHLALKRLAKIMLTRRRRFFLARIILTRRMMI